MPLTLPYTIAPADDINAEPLQANFQAVIDKFSAGITDGDISPLAAIQGSKLASNSVNGDRIQSGTITQTQMGANSVGASQLIALGVSKDKLATDVGKKITQTQMELYVYAPTTATFTLGSTTFLGATLAIKQTVVGGVNSWYVELHVTTKSVGGVPSDNVVNVIPPTAIPVATTQPIGALFKNLSIVSGSFTYDIDLLYLNKS